MLAPYTRSLHLWAPSPARGGPSVPFHEVPDGKVFYVFESFSKKEWQTDTVTPFLGPSVSGTPIFLGIDQKNYWAQIVRVTLKHKFE